MKIGNWDFRKDRIMKKTKYGTSTYYLTKHEIKQAKKFLLATEIKMHNPDNIDLMLEGTDKEIYDLNRLQEQHIREIERIDNKIEKLCLTQMENKNVITR